MNNIVFCFCCKNSQYIYDAVASVKRIYKDTADIIIVDSASSDKSYYSIQNNYNNIYIEDISNIYYEYGAIVHSFEKYPMYKNYIFLQDTIRLIKPINNLDNILDDTVYVIEENYTGWNLALDQKTEFMKINPNFPINVDLDRILLTIFNTFIINQKTMNKIINSELFKSCTPAHNKHLSIAWERVWSIIFNLHHINISVIKNNEEICFYKIHGKRD